MQVGFNHCATPPVLGFMFIDVSVIVSVKAEQPLPGASKNRDTVYVSGSLAPQRLVCRCLKMGSGSTIRSRAMQEQGCTKAPCPEPD